MNKHFTPIILTCLIALFSGCSGFLEEDPQGNQREDNAYNNKQEIFQNAVLSLYNHIGGSADYQGLQGCGRGIYDLNTFTTDEAIMPTRGGDWYDGGFWQGLYLHRWGVNNEAIYGTWEYLYQAVILCNRSLEKIDEYAARHPEEQAELDSYRAEVRAVRALFYYHLMDLFGNIPLLEKSDYQLREITQDERSDLFWFIVGELQESLSLLSPSPSNVPGVYYGRMTRPVCHFLLAKLALNAEIYCDNQWTDGVRPNGKDIHFLIDGKEMNAWETVIHYCDCLTAAGYELESDYASNFAVFNESSKENIFTIPMDKTLYSNLYIYLFRSRHYNHAKAYGLGGENGASATLEVLETYGYGTDYTDPRFEANYFAGPVKDLQGNQIYLDDGRTPLVYEPEEIALDLSGKRAEKTAGARIKKYEADPKSLQDGKLIDNDIVLFRYADVLLMKSEAKVRNGANGDAELNEVRQRVNAPFRPATLENILAERQLELAWEGWRRQDLIRFGLFTRSYSFRPALEQEANGYTTVFPIPDQVLRMSPKMKQNQGY